MNGFDQHAPRLHPARRAADIARIRELAASPDNAPGRRLAWRTVLALTVGILVAGAGVATAAVVLAPESPTNTTIGRCYWQASTDTGDGFPGTTAASASAADGWTPELVGNLIEDCAALWRAGVFQLDSPGINQATSGMYPMPQLTACVLPQGEAAVFPNTTCDQLGFAPMSTGS